MEKIWRDLKKLSLEARMLLKFMEVIRKWKIGLKKLIKEKRSQIQTLEKAQIESDDKEERAKLGETLTKVRSELDEAEKQLANVEDKEKNKKK